MKHYCKIFERTILLVIIYNNRFQQQQRLLKQITYFKIAKKNHVRKQRKKQQSFYRTKKLLINDLPPFTIFTPPPTYPVLSHFQDELQVSPALPILPQSLSFPDYTRHMKQLKTVCTHSFQDTDNHSVSANQLHFHECCDDDRNYTSVQQLYKFDMECKSDHATPALQQKQEKKIHLQSFKLSTVQGKKITNYFDQLHEGTKKPPPTIRFLFSFSK